MNVSQFMRMTWFNSELLMRFPWRSVRDCDRHQGFNTINGVIKNDLMVVFAAQKGDHYDKKVWEGVVLRRFQQLLQPAQKTPVPDEIRDRRRLGRDNQVSPHLIPLLRNPAILDIPALLPGKMNAPPSREDHAFIKGLISASALSVLLWAGIITVGWAVLH